MRNRLIELLNSQNRRCSARGSDKCPYINSEDCNTEGIADRILADGWIRQPCKVGDTIYALCNSSRFGNKTVVVPYIVDEIHFSTKRGIRPWVVCCYGGRRFDNLDFGKVAFYSAEEAKKTLKNAQVNEWLHSDIDGLIDAEY